MPRGRASPQDITAQVISTLPASGGHGRRRQAADAVIGRSRQPEVAARPAAVVGPGIVGVGIEPGLDPPGRIGIAPLDVRCRRRPRPLRGKGIRRQFDPPADDIRAGKARLHRHDPVGPHPAVGIGQKDQTALAAELTRDAGSHLPRGSGMGLRCRKHPFDDDEVQPQTGTGKPRPCGGSIDRIVHEQSDRPPNRGAVEGCGNAFEATADFGLLVAGGDGDGRHAASGAHGVMTHLKQSERLSRKVS